MELVPAKIEWKPVDVGRDTPFHVAKVVIVQTGDNRGNDDDDGGDLCFALSHYEREDDDDRSDNVTAKDEDGNELSLVYSKCDELECDELDDDELAGLKIDLDISSEEKLNAHDDHPIFVKLTSFSPTPLAAIDPAILPTVASEELVEDDTSFLPTSDAPMVDEDLGKFKLTNTIGALAPEEPPGPSNNTPEVVDDGNAESETIVTNCSLGSLWTFDDHYPNAGLIHCSCHLASRPWPNYCM